MVIMTRNTRETIWWCGDCGGITMGPVAQKHCNKPMHNIGVIEHKGGTDAEETGLEDKNDE